MLILRKVINLKPYHVHGGISEMCVTRDLTDVEVEINRTSYSTGLFSLHRRQGDVGEGQ